MKNLILIRHAKSSWDAPLKDIDRTLENRGIKDAHLVAINSISFIPKTFLIYSSPAKRAAETAMIFAQNLSYPIDEIIFKNELYTFDEKQLEDFIKNLNNINENVIIFGHNEAITNFVNKFGDVLIDNVATSGFVSIKFDITNWNTLIKGKTSKIIFPKDLK